MDEHVIDVTRGGAAPAPSSSPAALGYRLVPVTRGGDVLGFSHRDSCLWISIELVVIVTQFVAAIAVICLLRHGHPRAPLFVFTTVYATGCVAALPRLCWRYVRGSGRGTDQESEHSHQSSLQSNPSSSRVSVTRDLAHMFSGPSRFEKYVLPASPSTFVTECFFIVWYIVGALWVDLLGGSHRSTDDDPFVYRYCIPFLSYSPWLMLVMIVIREGAVDDVGTTYKFKSKLESQLGIEVSAARADEEKIISAEDAVCCICLAEYVDNDDLLELRCAHIFHMECVDKWLKRHPTCPLCKKEALSGGGDS